MRNHNDDLHLALRAGKIRQERQGRVRVKTQINSSGVKKRGTTKAQAPFRAQGKLQQVVVQVAYGLNKGQANWGAHGKYLAREDAQVEDEQGLGFDAAQDDKDLEATLSSWQGEQDKHFFKIMVSAESGAEMDLKTHTRDLVGQMEKDLGTRLEWVAIDHYNTANPHVHLAIRGVDEQGQVLWMDKHYICHGIRQRAREGATRQLGIRTEQDRQRERLRLIEAERYTKLDRALQRKAERNVITYNDQPATPAGQARRAEEIGRLQKLESMGLAERVGANRWQLQQDMEQSLRQLQASRDHIKRQAQILNRGRERLNRTLDDIERGRGR